MSFDEFGHVTEVKKHTLDFTAHSKSGGGGMLNLICDSSGATQPKIVNIDGAGATTVTVATQGNITISSTDTNTAHTHSTKEGSGITANGTGGLADDTTFSLNVKFGELKNNKLQLLSADNNAVLAEFDASDFVKDSYLKNAVYDPDTNILTFTFVTNDDNLQAIPVDLTDLVDVYTASLGIEKKGSDFQLTEATRASLALADSAVQPTDIEDLASITYVDEQVAAAKKYADDNDANTTYRLSAESNSSQGTVKLTPSEGNATTVTFNSADGAIQIYSANDYVNFGVKIGKGLSIDTQGATGLIHANTSDVANVTKTARTYVTGMTFDEFGHVTAVETAAEVDQDLSGYKTKQGAVADPTMSGSALEFIATISQNENGVITATKKQVDLSNYVSLSYADNHYKKIQTAVTNSTSAKKVITSLTQDAQGVITYTAEEQSIYNNKETYTGKDAVEYLIFNCGSASTLIDNHA